MVDWLVANIEGDSSDEFGLEFCFVLRGFVGTSEIRTEMFGKVLV